jgi:hypothetical protein
MAPSASQVTIPTSRPSIRISANGVPPALAVRTRRPSGLALSGDIGRPVHHRRPRFVHGRYPDPDAVYHGVIVVVLVWGVIAVARDTA